MSEKREPQDARPSRDDVDDIADASLGVDTRIFRTLWDTFLFTPRVVAAAFAGDRKTYVPIIRLFLVLFGAQYAVMAFVGLPVGLTLDSLVSTGASISVALPIWLERGGQDFETVNRTLEQAAALTTTPLVFLSSLLYVLLMKAYRPSRSIFGHALAYLAPVNASYLAMFLVMGCVYLIGVLLQWPREAIIAGFLFSLMISMVWFFVAIGRILARFYGRSILAVTLQVAGLVLLFVPMMLLISFSQYVIAEIVLQQAYDMSIFELMTLTPEANTEGPSS